MMKLPDRFRNRVTWKDAISRLLRVALYLTLGFAALVSLPHLGRYTPLPVASMLDAWLMCLVVLRLIWQRPKKILYVVIVLAYCAVLATIGLSNAAPVVDFLQAYKWLFYLGILSLSVGRCWGSVQGLIILTWMLVATATLNAGLTFLLKGPGSRPALLAENNFEIALYSGLLVLLYQHMGKWRPILVVLLGVFVALSESRSGAVVFVIAAVYVIFATSIHYKWLRIARIVALPVLGVIPVAIFIARAARTSFGIDRLNFLQVFLDETADRGFWGWLLGELPLTPLTSTSCERLSFYQSLFATAGDGTCYSVIMHAFILRILFDSGILGLVLSIVLPILCMRAAGVHVGTIFALVAISLANGVSVSGLNNPYVTLPFILAVLISGNTTQSEVDLTQKLPRHAKPSNKIWVAKGRRSA